MAELILQVGRVKSLSVKKGSGKNWDQWVSILQQAGAAHWTHKEIVSFLVSKYKLSPWWRQIVASGFEQHLGKKIEGRNDKGEYSLTSTKTFSISGAKLWKYLVSSKGQQMWLKPMTPIKFQPKATYEREDGIFGEIRTMKAGERIRMTWQETEWEKPSIVQIYVVSRKQGNSILVFMHEKLMQARLRPAMREHWQSVLTDVWTAIESPAVISRKTKS